MIISESLDKEIREYIEKDQPEFYWDYNSSLSASEVAKSLQDEDSYHEMLNELWDINGEYIYDLEKEKLKETAKEFFSRICEENDWNFDDFDDFWDDYEDDFREKFEDAIAVDLNEKDLIKRSEGIILTQIDCIDYDIYAEKKRNEYNDLKEVLAFANINPRKFAIDFGYNPISFPDIPSRNGHEKFTPESIDRMFCENTSGTMVCLGGPDFEEYVDNRKAFDKGILIRAGSPFVSHNFHVGSTSCEIESIDDITLVSKHQSYSFYEDTTVSYGVQNTCGFVSSAFKGVIEKLDFKTKNKNQNGFRSKTYQKNLQTQ